MRFKSTREKIQIEREIEEIQRKGRELVKKCGNPIRLVPETKPMQSGAGSSEHLEVLTDDRI